VHGLEGKYGGCVDFVYLDIDNPATQAAKNRLGYLAQPHFFLLDKSGKVVWRKVGVITAAEIEDQFQFVIQR
jgi:hypothetical protein